MSPGGVQYWRLGRPLILAGRLLATVFTALILPLFIVALVPAEGASLSAEDVGVALVLALAVLAVIIAWWDPSLGAYALATAGLAFVFLVAVIADSNQITAMAVLSWPYFLSSLLIWFGLWRLIET